MHSEASDGDNCVEVAEEEHVRDEEFLGSQPPSRSASESPRWLEEVVPRLKMMIDLSAWPWLNVYCVLWRAGMNGTRCAQDVFMRKCFALTVDVMRWRSTANENELFF